DVTDLLDSLFIGYDKRLRPNYKGQPVIVGVTLHIIKFSSISEANMDFTIEFFFVQHWTDDRLKFDSSTFNITSHELYISNVMLDKLWWPDTFFANAKNAKFHEATARNMFLKLSENGTVTLSIRLTVVVSCMMDLTYFPMDKQICSLVIESYAYSTRHIAYNWLGRADQSVTTNNNCQMIEAKVIGIKVINKTTILSTGLFSSLSCLFYLKRNLIYYIIHTYMPSTLIVVSSWLSFWLPKDAGPARIALGITTVLTITTLMSASNASLPKISYLKSIDLYTITCFLFIFASIVEYAIVSYVS
ncbi:hypothetical protein HELRODRAFT_121545, partial [Helobdella robusta]|uniref:Gamma-aminobutyric acid receptor subunit beta n=1 Tax=Helobdella robusta TaxID=6412 RepID=T1EGS3_HELRO